MKRLLAVLILLALAWVGYQYYVKKGSLSVDESQVQSAREAARETVGAVGDKLRQTKTTGSVKAAFELNRSLAPYPIEVSADGDVVVLRGDVPNEETRALAEKVAVNVPDVTQVRNELRVSGAPLPPATGDQRSIGENVDDRAVETKVRLAFSLNKDLKGTDISVSSYRKAVTLGGEVGTEAQHQAALLVARDTAGVASVTDQIRVGGSAGAPPGSAPPATAPQGTPTGAGPAVAAQAAERALAQSPSLAAYGLKVQENNGRLVLTGRVRTSAEKELAGLTARDAAHTTVDNAIEIRP